MKLCPRFFQLRVRAAACSLLPSGPFRFDLTVSPEARLTVLAKPIVSAVPSNQVSFVGAQAGFSVNFADTEPFNYYWRGTEPFTFQWRHDGTNLVGATNQTLRIEDLEPPILTWKEQLVLTEAREEREARTI